MIVCCIAGDLTLGEAICFLFWIGCTCNAEGSENTACDTAGKCTCKPNVVGNDCDKCAEGYFGFPDCQGKYMPVY